MKSKLTVIGTALLLINFLLSGCSTSDDYLREFEVKRMIEEALKENNKDLYFTEWNIENFTVKASDWSWNSNLNRWENVRKLKYIDEFIYESGAVIGYIFIGTQDIDEIQIQLPYIQSYLVKNDQGELFNFTETIGSEYSYLTNSITFFIEPSDGFQDPGAKQNYNFRIVMIW